MDKVLTDTLSARGFNVTQPLKGAGQAKIFCVKEQQGSDDIFVAKVVSLTGLDAKGRASALQEVSMLRGLAPHPNLIAYRESFLEEAAGVLLIVMSFAEDGDLRRMVSKTQQIQRRMPQPVIVWWLRQMLAGIQHLHAQGVVHRDLKSSNIFLCEGHRRIRIGDFGISRVLESTAFASSCVGTPAYMSPELMRNERYDYHVDMWAMGCICFELCTLNLPFEARSLLDLVYKVVEGEPDWSLWSGYSQDLQDTTKQLLQKDANSRPTAEVLLENAMFAIQEEPARSIWEQLPATSSSLSEEMQAAKVPALQLSQETDTSADTAAMPLSAEGGSTWTSTPRLPWDSTMSANSNRTPASRGATASSDLTLESFTDSSIGGQTDSFARKFQEARESQQQFSTRDFKDFLETQRENMLADLKNVTSGSAGLQGAANDRSQEASITLM